MVFDAHDRAFAFFKGTCTRGIYDKPGVKRPAPVPKGTASPERDAVGKTAVDAVFVGKDRQFNRRFLQMCSHYLIEPTACTPASGWGENGPWPKAA